MSVEEPAQTTGESSAGTIREASPSDSPATEPAGGPSPVRDLVRPSHLEPARPRPVSQTERVASVDVLRGVALLGILAMNIVDFAWPSSVYSIPILAEGHGPADVWLWGFNHLVFDTKMMTLFSMLFGAGLALMTDRAATSRARLGKVYYRRVFWLLVIGLCHAILIWQGDILVLYALCGFLLYPFRNLRPRTLIITGVVFNLLLIVVLFGFRVAGVPYMRATFDRVEAQQKAGETPSGWAQGVHDAWKDMSKEEAPKREETLEEIARHRGPYLGLVAERSKNVFLEMLFFLISGWWLAGGRMLVGMGLMKLGVFSAELPVSVYRKMVVWGYAIGLPLLLFDAFHQVYHGFFVGHMLWYFLDGWPLITILGSLPVVVGHVGLVMWICKAGKLRWLTRRLAAVGRMALTNYLGTSLVCTTLFYGHGFDLYATLHRPMLYAIVFTIWTAQLLLSPIWLEYFRFGPAEWLWRSLTYFQLQPMRQRKPEPVVPAHA